MHFWTDEPLRMLSPEQWLQEMETSQSTDASQLDRFTAKVNLISRVLLVVGAVFCFWKGRIDTWILWAFTLLLVAAAYFELLPTIRARDRSEGFRVDNNNSSRPIQPMTQAPQPSNPFGNPSPLDRPDRSPAPLYDEPTRDAIRAAAIDQMRGDPHYASLVHMLDQGEPSAWYHFERMMYSFHSMPVTSVVNEGQEQLYASLRRTSPRIEAKEKFITRFVAS